MKAVCTSDLHGNLQNNLPAGDLLIVAGDLSPATQEMHSPMAQAIWHRRKFIPWLKRQPMKRKVVIWGNHDWLGEKAPSQIPDELKEYLVTDDTVVVEGYKIFCTPRQLPFCNWAFNSPELDLMRIFESVDEADIIVSHGPPYGYQDLAPPSRSIGRTEWEHTGSHALFDMIIRTKPLLVVCGHIHCGYGLATIPGTGTLVANVSLVDERYSVKNKPMVFDIVDRTITPVL